MKKIKVKITREELKEGAFSKRIKLSTDDDEKHKDRESTILVQLMRRSVI